MTALIEASNLVRAMVVSGYEEKKNGIQWKKRTTEKFPR
jgi:hypothetical protein